MNGCIFRCLALGLLLVCASAARAEIYTVPLLVSSGMSGGPQGVVRIVNGTDGSGTVAIHAIDDDGGRHGPATFTLDASAAAEFTAADLASGNAAEGLSGGIGSRSGDVRLEIDTDLDIVPLAFVRAPDGTLSAMHDTVRAASAAAAGQHRYEVPAFNPASDAVQASRLRLINPADSAAAVTVAGRDDSGAAATGGDVRLTLPAGGARTLTAQQLEAGATGLSGQLGAGTGRWRLTVSADVPLEVVNVVTAPAGYWSNLSTTAAPGLAPSTRAVFDARYLDRAIVYRAGSERSTFLVQSGGRFSETNESDGVTETYVGDYGYRRIGPDAGRMSVLYDDGGLCDVHLYFSTRTAGWFASRCAYAGDTAAYWSGGSWAVGEQDEPGDSGMSYGVGDTVATLPTGSWAPDITSGGNFSLSGADVTIRLDDGGYIETGGHRYTCQSAGGCEIVNRQVRSGTIAQTAAGTEPPPADTSPVFAADSGPGDQSYTAGAAIAALTLPTATGGDGTLTYALTPSVPGLSFDAATRRLTGMPSGAGAHDMTYTATDVDGDTATLRFSIAVRAAGGGPVAFDLHADNGRAEGLTWADGRVYVVDGNADKVFAYGLGGQHVAAEDFDLHADNANPTGIVWSGGSFHVLDGADDKVYAYGPDGLRNAAAEFDLQGGNDRAEGIVHALGLFYVVDRGADRVFAYRSDGQRDAAAEFDLQGGNGNPAGIAQAGERFYVADATDDRVYVYSSGGQRDAATDFVLQGENGNPAGIAWVGGVFLVADAADDKVYAYSGGGEAAYQTGDTVAGLPTGFWTPDITSGGSFGANGGDVTIQLDNGGYIEEGDYRYTCLWSGGCEIINREVWRGTIVQTVSGTAPGIQPPPADTSPSFADGGGPVDQSYTAGVAIDGLTLPAATGGDGALTYSLSPEVPGLTFEAASRQLTGTPTSEASYNMTYTVTDADGDTDTVAFSITVSGTRPGFAIGGTPGNQTYTTGIAIDPLTLPEATGGDGTLTYRLSPDVPGLTFNSTTRQLAGTPTTAGDHSMIYTATDSDGDSDTLNFAITVEDLETFSLHYRGNVSPEGITYANGRFYVVDRTRHRVFAYSATTGQREVEAEFDLHSENAAPAGITFAHNRFYVVSGADFRVFAYSATTGLRDEAAEFVMELPYSVLDGSNLRITYGNDRFYVYYQGRVYVYSATTGQREEEFVAGGFVEGIAYSDGQVYILRFGSRCHPLVPCPLELIGEVYSVTGSEPERVGEFGSVHPIPGSNSRGGIAYASGRLHIVDRHELKVHAISASTGRRELAAEFELEHNADGALSVGGITYANNRFYVVDLLADRVYAYDPITGQRDKESEFELHLAADGHIAGITYANNRLHVLDAPNVFAYSATTGKREVTADFNLHDDNSAPAGITYANGRFYVVNFFYKVNAYSAATGQREEEVEFDLHSDQGLSNGITYANGRFHIVDWRTHRVYAYSATTGQRDSAAEFDLHPDNGLPTGITYANDRFLVLDGHKFKVYAYTQR